MRLNTLEKILLGGKIRPFERNRFRKDEEIPEPDKRILSDHLVHITRKNIPDEIKKINYNGKKEDIQNAVEKRDIWVLTENGFELLFEKNKSPGSKRAKVCHTNITGGARAFHGGELWFTTDNAVLINKYSGRYDDRKNYQWVYLLYLLRKKLGLEIIDISQFGRFK